MSILSWLKDPCSLHICTRPDHRHHKGIYPYKEAVLKKIVLKIAALTVWTVVTHYQLDLMENHPHLFVCMRVDRWPLRGYHTLSGSHLMRPQGFEPKIFFFLIIFINPLNICPTTPGQIHDLATLHICEAQKKKMHQTNMLAAHA